VCGSASGDRLPFHSEENAKPETAYFGGMAWRVVRAIEYLKSLPEWNGRDLTVRGGSQGALIETLFDNKENHA